ncbi:DNA primase [Salinicoccus sp. ID82-1]|uniref:DNA primase n=1 Tax=Salinicoccus sp. ID82-1 TaxID=2820269 RepID=UPI001F012595|nr:DNA primase [Salinicoccus sp. ID82-1]MCG1008985.1 DNA primase [Salinicoccus sp. ID82-1]
MRIPDETVEAVKQGTDITELVSSYIKLEKRGRNYVGLCPFHNEKTPSFTVSPDKQICHCFGCKKGGNVLQFYMEVENVSFAEAVRKLGKPLGVEIAAAEESASDSEMQLIKIHEYMTDLYHHILMHTKEGEEALKYLEDRGFTPEIIRKEKIGIAPDMRDFTKNALSDKGFSLELAFQAGIISRNEENFSYYDRFNGRIMIPIRNHQGYIVGYTARSVDGREPKYLNTPETSIFQKRRLLYNLSDARKDIRKQDEVILMEGHLDIVKVKMTSVGNVIGLMGTALSEQHIQSLNRLASNVTLMFDGDDAGQNAQLSLGADLLEAGLNVFVISMPKGMDPDEYIEKNGKAAFENLVKNEKRHYIHFKAEYLLEESMNNDMAFSNNIRTLTEHLKYVGDQVIKDRLIQHISQLYKVDRQSIEQNVPAPSYDHAPRRVAQPRQKQPPLRERKERYLLRALMKDKSLLVNFENNIDEEVLTTPVYYVIFKGLCRYFDKYDEFDISSFSQYIEGEHFSSAMEVDALVIHDDITTEEVNDYIEDLSGIRNSEKEKQLLLLKLQDAENSNDDELQARLVQQLNEINSRYKR